MINNDLTSRDYYEVVDLNVLDRVIKKLEDPEFELEKHHSEDFNKDPLEFKNEYIKRLKLIRSNVKNNELKVGYKYNIENFGRVYAINGLSIGGLHRSIRGTLAQDNYVDIDIVNAQPSMMLQLFKKNGINAPLLKQYIEEREKVLEMISDHYSVTRDQSKNLVIRILYGGELSSWKKDLNISNKKKDLEFISKFQDETFENYEVFLKLEDNKKTVKLLEDNDKVKENNVKGSIMAHIMQNEERRVLEVMIDYIRKYKLGVRNTILCYDGFMMLKKNFSEFILKNIQDMVKEKTGYAIKLETKGFKVIDIETEAGVFKADNTGCFEREVLLQCCQCGYLSAKEYFERYYCYCSETHNFIYVNMANNVVSQLEAKVIRDEFAGVIVPTEVENNKPVEFTKLWLKDPNKKIVESIVFDAYSGPLSIDKVFGSEYDPTRNHVKHYVNTFHGYNPLIALDPDSISDEAREMEEDWYNNYYHPVLHALCENDDECTEYVWGYLCQLVQHPEERPNKSLVFVSELQGVGKNSVLQAVSRVIGRHNYNEAEDIREAYFSPHAVGHYNKLLVTADEAKANFDLEGALKNFITNPYVIINKKFEKQFTVKNLARLVITSNKIDALAIDFNSNDRRFECFLADKRFGHMRIETPEKYKEFFDHFYKVINADWFPCLFYKRMMNEDLSSWKDNGLCNKTTKLKDMMKSRFKDSISLWIDESYEELIGRDYDIERHRYKNFRAYDFYNLYKDFCSEHGLKPVKGTVFPSDLLRLFPFITKKKGSSANLYVIDVEKYHAYDIENGDVNICDMIDLDEK